MNSKERKYKDSELIKKLVPYVKPVLKSFIFAIILTLILVVLDLVGPFAQGKIIKVLTMNEESFRTDFSIFGIENLTFSEAKIKVVGMISLIYALAIILSATLNYVSSMTLQKAGQKMIFDMREKVFCHIEELSIAQINAQPVGKLVTRVTNDTNALSDLCTTVVVNLIKYIFTIIAVFVAMFILSYKISLFMLIIVPILFVMTLIFKHFSRNAYRGVRTNISNMNAFLSENISGMKITQIFNQEDKKYLEFKMKNEELKKSSIKEIFVFSIFRPLIYVLFVCSEALVLFIGGNLVLSGKMGIDGLVAYYQYISSLFTPIQNLADQFNQLQSALASCEKIFDILDTNKDILDKEDAIDCPHLKGSIEFDHVWFAYNEGVWILKDVSFKIEPGETAAFVGATGAGKTTILSLIVRNYEIQKGRILIDGKDIHDYKIESLRKNIGQMLQDVFLFSGTIRQNISLRSNDITDEEIMDACKYVNANTFIDKLPLGLDYKVEERGVNFSQGQRQLLSFARTIVHKPNIMILDEATSNIDTETEKIIQDSLEKMMNIGTMLIVAHRLSTIQHADKIIVLHHGEIMEIGNHQELLKKKGMYYSLYQLQYKHLEEN